MGRRCCNNLTASNMELKFYNTLTRKKEIFVPIRHEDVRMYVCGPTVYDRPHLGNARSVVVYDVLYRLLTEVFPKVTYARNITDVDDKINAAAKANGEPISALTQRVEGWFYDDMRALNCASPTVEPRATEHIPQMVAIIEKLIARGHAYVAQGHVLFDVTSYAAYGQLSGRKLDDLISGARVEVESYKKNPGDFVLWKPAESGDDASSVFGSPWGAGRPGWHIECSAMSAQYLGDNFDIHGGGSDLMFPHHENEIAQSCCAKPGVEFAKCWIHNGFLTVNGEKMSKSLGNFTTVKDLLDKGVKGEVIRMALLMSKYNEPMDWNGKLLHDAELTLGKFYKMLDVEEEAREVPDEFLAALGDDLNTPRAFSTLYSMHPGEAVAALRFMGFLQMRAKDWFFKETPKDAKVDEAWVLGKIAARIEAKQNKQWAEADALRKEITDHGIVVKDRPDGTTDWDWA